MKLVAIKQHRRKNGQQVWAAYYDDQLGVLGKNQEKARISVAESPVRLILWCVCNRVIDISTTVLLDYDTDPVTDSDIHALIKHFGKIFGPVRVNAIPREALLSPMQIKACMAVVNFTSSRLKPTVDEVTVIYTTTWGETYVVPGKESLDKLWFELQESVPRPPCYIFVPESSQRKRIYQAFIDAAEQDFELLNYW